MSKDSKNNTSLIESYNKGYRIINEKIFYKNKEVKVNLKKTGYFGFCIRLKNGERYVIMVHRLVAYQKYGDEMFDKDVRHKDGNSKNNREDNIILGTHSENMMDIPENIRYNKAVHASSFIKKHNHEEIIKLHNEGVSYKKIMEQFNIKSKGTISFIINKSIEMKADVAQLVEQQTENLRVAGSIPAIRTKA